MGWYIKSAISHVCCAYTHLFDAGSLTHAHIFDAEGFACNAIMVHALLLAHDSEDSN